MTLWEALSLLLGPLCGWFAVGFLWPEVRAGRALLRLSLGSLLGWGGLSVLFFLLRHVLGMGGHPLIWEAPLLIALIAANKIRRTPESRLEACTLSKSTGTTWRIYADADMGKFRLFGMTGLLEGLFTTTLLIAANMQVLLFQALPGGGWDAYGQWNMRARQLMAAPECFATSLFTSGHGDYPLFVPGLIARTWSYGPGPDYMTPAVVGVLLAATLLTLLLSGVSQFKGRQAGLVAGIVLLGTWLFLRLGAYQYADIPLAGCVLATVIALAAAGKGCGGWLMAGAAAGLGVWTKNEGSVFWIVILGVIVMAGALTRQSPRAIITGLWRFLVGCAPFVLTTLYFRFAWAPENALARATTLDEILDKMTTLARHSEVLQTFAKELFLFQRWGYAPLLLLVFLLLARWRKPRDWGWGLLMGWMGIAALFLAYYAVYVLTPRELTWHLSTSLNRLLMHAWPSIVFLALVSVALPVWRADVPPQAGSAPAQK